MPLMPCSALSVTLMKAVTRPMTSADADADEDRDEQAARLEGGVVGAESAEQHDPVDAEVDHAAALAHGLAEGGEQEGRGAAGCPTPRWR